ncbi:MAG: ribosomal RNA small subunit methyltransferase A [Phycisphaeraceae bacterium]|nr:MAG: ribosomal RNA small subunit methyltransferase A [Phycisphaeraceae bacterium]
MAQTLTEIKELLAERGMSPRKSLGQNFLIDQNLARRLVETSGVGPGDLVLEVGPGTGALTEVTLDAGCEVIACELDAGLAGLLRDRFEGESRFSLVEGDCLGRGKSLSEDVARALDGRPFTLVANLPYGAATTLMLTLLTKWPACKGQFVTIQKEVADRLLAGPATPKAYGGISVIAQALGTVERVATLAPECFWPRPEITSAMVSVRRRPDPLEPDPDRWPRLAELVAEIFAQRRKQLGSTLKRLNAGGLELPEGVLATHRPEALSVEQVVALCRGVDGMGAREGG